MVSSIRHGAGLLGGYQTTLKRYYAIYSEPREQAEYAYYAVSAANGIANTTAAVRRLVTKHKNEDITLKCALSSFFYIIMPLQWSISCCIICAVNPE